MRGANGCCAWTIHRASPAKPAAIMTSTVSRETLFMSPSEPHDVGHAQHAHIVVEGLLEARENAARSSRSYLHALIHRIGVVHVDVRIASTDRLPGVDRIAHVEPDLV